MSLLAILLLSKFAAAAPLPKCLFINSYHKGYGWSDGIEKAVYANLKNDCEITSFYLDAKNFPDKEKQRARAMVGKELILKMAPALVIAADDNVSQEIVLPYFKDSNIPILFCGINWSTKKYGYPFKNVTGMIEVTPVQPLIQEAKRVFRNIKRATFLAGDVAADRENFEIYKEIFKKEGIELSSKLVKNLNEWERAYKEAQKTDLVLVVNNAGISDWSDEHVKQIVLSETKKPSITSHEYMVKYSMLSFTKIAAEQGEWVASAAKEILKGVPISKIPMVTNRRWNIFANEILLKKINVNLPRKLKNKTSLVQL